MTKYCAGIVTDVGEETVALFSDRANVKAMVSFAEDQFQCGNSVITPCKKIYIKDLITGKVVHECKLAAEETEPLEGQWCFDDFLKENNT